MYLLRVSQKILFICNLCWLGGWIFRLGGLAHWPAAIVKTVLVLGWVVALPLGIVWYGAVLLLRYRGAFSAAQVSRWMLPVNAVFLGVMALYRLLG